MHDEQGLEPESYKTFTPEEWREVLAIIDRCPRKGE